MDSRRRTVPYPALLAFSISAAILLLQLTQTRIYGVVFWNHLVYFIISIALLGFGISGTWLSFGKETWLARHLTLRNAAVGFVVSTLVSSILIPQVAVSSGEIFSSTARLAQLLITYSIAIVPYFFAGWMLGALFRDHIRHIHFLYFADLVGAGLGCLLFLAAMQRVGAINLILIVCAAVALPVFAGDIQRRSTKIWSVACVALLITLSLSSGALNARIVPEPTKAFVALYKDNPADRNLVLSEWNPISRIDVVETASWPGEHRIFIDGDAWTGFSPRWETPPTPFLPDEKMLTHRAPYFFERQRDSALVVGSGGGVDVYFALKGGAKKVDAIEINPTTYRIMLEEFREASNGMLTQPSVNAYNEEGRSFIRRSDKKYDTIMLHGIDTFAALNAGAYVLSENYLYTVEAIQDYVSHLSDDGILCITRWLHTPETSRLFIVCLEALHEMGVENPERHIILHGDSGRAGGGAVMVSRSPFTAQEMAQFAAHAKAHNGDMFYPNTFDTPHRIASIASNYVESRAVGEQGAYLDSLDMNLSPVTDDSPFFFHFDKARYMLRVLHEQGAPQLIRGHWPSFTLFSLLGFTALVLLLFMFLPLLQRGRPHVPGFGRWLTYFSCLGFSFIFVEIALMQRFALLLGHPSRSLALVLAALLIFAGVGSQLQGRLRLRLEWCLGLLAALILAAAFVYPYAISALLGTSFAVRALATVLMVAPLGILMGMPFPTGLNRVSVAGAEAVPWMWGVNGGTTVLGSILAIILAIWLGFVSVLLLGAAGYLLALLMYVLLKTCPLPPQTGDMPLDAPVAHSETLTSAKA